MWKAEFTKNAQATPEALWERWTDVANWPQQDESLQSASINGPFAVGSIITLKPKGSPTVNVQLIEVTSLKSFSSTGQLPLAKLQFDHKAKSDAGKIEFTQSVTMSGPLSSLFSRLMGKKMAENLEARMTKLAALLDSK
jgi:Polyketide cyclase / dehydrase and lipid transport